MIWQPYPVQRNRSCNISVSSTLPFKKYSYFLTIPLNPPGHQYIMDDLFHLGIRDGLFRPGIKDGLFRLGIRRMIPAAGHKHKQGRQQDDGCTVIVSF